MNHFFGVGRLGKDAAFRYTQNGNAVAGFPLAVDVGYGKHKDTVWIDCSLFGKQATGNVVQHLIKGRQVAVTGEISLRRFKHQDGTPDARITLTISRLSLVGDRIPGKAPAPTGEDAEIPF